MNACASGLFCPSCPKESGFTTGVSQPSEVKWAMFWNADDEGDGDGDGDGDDVAEEDGAVAVERLEAL